MHKTDLVENVKFVDPRDKENVRQVALGNKSINYVKQTHETFDTFHDPQIDLEEHPVKNKIRYNDFEK